MATTNYKISDIPNLENQISNLENERDTVKGRLQSSPTALGGSGTPTGSDLANQETLDSINKKIQSLNDSKLRTQWYGPKDKNASTATGEELDSPGAIGKTLDFISRPLYGIVGATKHVIGQGSGSLQQDVADNMVRNKNTFGDVLKNSGTPYAVAAPLGFALDVMFDPVNWATMGTGALVPRLAYGAYKGAATGQGVLRGLSIAGKSGVLDKATTIARYTPYLKKSATFEKLGVKNLAAADAFENLTGKTAMDMVLEKGAGVGSFRIGLNDVINKVAEATPGGQSFLQHFVYDPAEWVRQARIKDVMQNALGTGVDVKEAVNAAARGESISPYLDDISAHITKTVEEMPAGKPIDFSIDFDGPAALMSRKEVDAHMAAIAAIDPALGQRLMAVAPKLVNGVDDTASIMKNPTPYVSGDKVENAVRLVNEKVGGAEITLEDIQKVVNAGVFDQTGVKWYDTMMNGIKSWQVSVGRNSNKVVEVGKRVMDNYDKAMAVFRVAKVGASPTAYVNAVAGNLIMSHLASGDIGPEFLARLKQVYNMYRNKSGAAAFIDDLLRNAGGEGDLIRSAILDSSTAARGTFGNTSFIGAKYNATRLIQAGRDAGVISSSVKAEDIAPDLQKVMEELQQFKAGTTQAREAFASGELVDRMSVGTGMLSNEMFNTRATAEMFRHITEKANGPDANMVWKLLDLTLNKMPSHYETVDQVFKMTTFIRSTVDGYTLNQLRQLRHIIDINPEELTKVAKGGEYRYTLSPETALVLSNVTYLNYNAMPAAVRVLRNLPLFGSPFISFMYGMTLKTGQTLAYNPAAFTKVNYALNEFGGTKSPTEKRALDTPFYSYLKQPGMFRVPFFEENPIYLNLASMIPYYSLNMFNPTKTNYGDSLPEQLVQTLQGSPFMKDPAGSVLFDFFIQPLILGEAIRPQGQFGQPLYPVDATAPEKLGYGVRTLAEAFTPNVAAYAGLVTPEKLAPFAPLYRWRAIAEAKYGKNQLGISSKESKTSRTVRELLKESGIPVQAPVNTTFRPDQP